MAIWFLFKETIVVIIICQVCVYSLDLLENLKLKRENSPELNNFLKSVLEKKEIFKNIRETANLLSHDDKSAMQHLKKHFPNASPSHSLKHFKREDSNFDDLRPINDVYPYADTSSSEKFETRSLRQRRFGHHHRKDNERLRRGLDLNDYNANGEYESKHVQINPRGEVGIREVPGEKYGHIFDSKKHFVLKRDLPPIPLSPRKVYKQPNGYVNIDSDRHFLTSSNFERLSPLYSNRESDQINKIIEKYEEASKNHEYYPAEEQQRLKKNFWTTPKPKGSSVESMLVQNDDDSHQGQKNTLLDVDQPTSAIEQYLLLTKPHFFVSPASFFTSLPPDAILDKLENTKSDEFPVKESKDMVHDSRLGNGQQRSKMDNPLIIDSNLQSQTDMKNTINNLVQALNEANRKLKTSKYLSNIRNNDVVEAQDFHKRKLLSYEDDVSSGSRYENIDGDLDYQNVDDELGKVRLKRRLPRTFANIYTNIDGNVNEIKNWEDEYGEEEDLGQSRKTTYNNKKNVKNHFDDKFIEVKSSEDEYGAEDTPTNVHNIDSKLSSTSNIHNGIVTTHNPKEMLGAKKHKTTHKKTCVITHAPPNIERRERDELPIQNSGGGCSRENSDCYHRKECNCEKCNANNEECPYCNEKQTDTCDEENKNETGDEGISYEIFTPKPEVGKTNKEYLEFKETTEDHSKHALKNKKPKTRQSVSDIPKKSITTKTNLKNIYTKFHSKHNENEFKQNDLRNVLEETSELDTIGDFQKTDANGANINERAIDVNREQVSFNAITTSNYETMEKRQILKNSEDAFSEFSVNVDKIKRDETFSYSTPTNNHRNLENVDSFKDVVEHVAIYKSLDARNRKKFWRSPIKHRPRALYLRHHPYRHYERLNPFHNYPYIRYADKENHHSYNNKRGHEKRIRRHSQFIDYHDILPHKDMKAAHTKRIVRWDKQHGGTPVKEWINPKNPIKDDGGGSEKQLNLNSEKFLGKSVESNDYGQMQDALSGHLASLIVDKVITELKSHKELSSRFLNGLSHRQHLGRDMKVLEAFLTSEAENDLKHKEQMMHNIMAALNKLVMDVVQRQTCKRISPELRKFLIRMIKQSRREIDEDSKIAEEGVPLPVVKSSKPRKASDYQPENSFLFHKSSKEVEHDQMVGNVQEKIEMVNGLIDRYDHLKSNCKDQASDVHEYLQKHLAMLQQIMRTLQEKKKTPRIAKDTSSLTGKFAHVQHSPKKPLISSFNVDAVFKEHLKKLKDKTSSNEESGTSYLNSHSKHQESHTNINSKNHNKSETKESAVSKQYQKLSETADYLRKNREADEKIGRLFSNSKDAENEETTSGNTENIDLSKIKFEQLVPYNLG